MKIISRLVNDMRYRTRRQIEEVVGPGFVEPQGLAYQSFLERIHEKYLFDWYMEIGCRSGDTFRSVRSKTIAVDPFFRLTTNVVQEKPSLLVFQQTSDDFFESGFLKTTGITPSFCFLDGMHLIEYLLRDFVNTEAAMTPQSVIAIHDCVPFNLGMTTRDLKNLPACSWTGDVWKMLPILRQYRPDLHVDVLDCSHTGLVLVSGLDPANTALADNMAAILAEWTDITLEAFGVDTFFSSFPQQDAEGFLAAGARIFDGIGQSPDAHLTPQFITP